MPKHEALTPKAISNRIKSIGLQKLRWYCQMCQKQVRMMCTAESCRLSTFLEKLSNAQNLNEFNTLFLQCRDENGFKCHTTSESHLRQMRLFAENPDQQIDEFSAEFERGFVEMLSYRHGTKRVLANRVYQEYIGDKHHIHMNATIWTSLTEICKYLGKEGKVTADETEKGWFIQYIDRDPRLLAKQAAMDQRKVVEYDQEERTKRAIELQIAACAESERRKRIEKGDDENYESAVVNEDLTREEGNKIEIAFGTKSGSGLVSKGIKRPLKLVSFGFDKSSEIENGSSKSRGDDVEPQSKRFLPPSSTSTSTSTFSTFSSFPASTSSNSSTTSTSTSTVQSSRTVPMTAMEQIRMEEEKRKILLKQKQKEASAENTEYWLQPGIVVKILNKKVGNGKFYQRKAVVLEVIDKFVGELNVLECNTILRIDQEHLETVIPKIGNTVKILNGYGKGKTANLTKINEEDFSCDIVYENERKEKKEIFGVVYENISKLYSGE